MSLPLSLIRIAGTAHSGSTALDLMLSNADNAFSCGEIDALFRPYRLHHFTPECGCGDPACDVWEAIRKAGEARWVDGVRQLFPRVEWLVDSSKDLNWIYDQNIIARRLNIPVHNILIWKTPTDYAYSRFKRGKLKGWLRAYINYHARYMSIVNDWIGVPYSQLAAEPGSTLGSVCGLMGMPYEKGKEQYWGRMHHTLFGSHAAKLHLHDKGTGTYQSIAESRERFELQVAGGSDNEVTHHKSIYYESANLKKLPARVVRDLETNGALQDVVRHLESRGYACLASNNATAASEISNVPPSSPGVWYAHHRYKRLGQYYSCMLRRCI